MKLHVKLTYFLVCLTFTPNFASATAYLKSRTSVLATENKNCEAYLHARDDAKGLPIVVLLAGTGVYSTRDIAEGNPFAKTLIDEKKAVFLSIDKPGISYDETSSTHFKIDDEVYNRYTQKDLIACVINAIKWASATPFSTESSDIYFLGHSEGTQISIRAYDEVLKNNAINANRIKGFFLSGLVMKSWDDIINSQFSDPIEKIKFWNAYQEHDDTALRRTGDLAYAYWNDILATESNETLFKKLALLKPDAFVQVYQGLQDENTSTKPVMDFENWNRDRLKQGEPGWRFQAHYYQAGHSLNLAAINDMIFAFMVYLTP